MYTYTRVGRNVYKVSSREWTTLLVRGVLGEIKIKWSYSPSTLELRDWKSRKFYGTWWNESRKTEISESICPFEVHIIWCHFRYIWRWNHLFFTLKSLNATHYMYIYLPLKSLHNQNSQFSFPFSRLPNAHPPTYPTNTVAKKLLFPSLSHPLPQYIYMIHQKPRGISVPFPKQI